MVATKDQKLEAMRLSIEEMTLNEAKAGQKHQEVRQRLDELLLQERESQRAMTALQEAKKRLEERLEECRLELAAVSGAASGKMSETSSRLAETERALQNATTELAKEAGLAAALRQKVAVLETELAVAREALLRTETAAAAGASELREQLQVETVRQRELREQAAAEASRKTAELTAELESARLEMKAIKETARQERETERAAVERLVGELGRARETMEERQAAAETAELKRQQAEAAAETARQRAREAERECEREREAGRVASQEAESCRALSVETEVQAEQAAKAAAEALRQVRDEQMQAVETAVARRKSGENGPDKPRPRQRHARHSWPTRSASGPVSASSCGLPCRRRMDGPRRRCERPNRGCLNRIELCLRRVQHWPTRSQNSPRRASECELWRRVWSKQKRHALVQRPTGRFDPTIWRTLFTRPSRRPNRL